MLDILLAGDPLADGAVQLLQYGALGVAAIASGVFVWKVYFDQRKTIIAKDAQLAEQAAAHAQREKEMQATLYEALRMQTLSTDLWRRGAGIEPGRPEPNV